MALNPRRPAFRMPWTADGPSDEEQDAPEAGSTVEAGDATSDSAAAPEAAPATQAAPSSQAAPAAEPASPAEAAASEAPAEEASASTMAGLAEAATAAAGNAESGEFLRSLVDAMRGVAESSRDASITELRQSVEARISAVQASGAESADELRRRAELDISGIGDWERSEADRIREEAERKRGQRREALERELAESQAATEGQVDATRKRLADHEAKLAAFFEELAGITDPAAFVVAAKRMPQAPELTDEPTVPATRAGADSASDAVSPSGGTDPRLAALGVTPASGADVPAGPQAEAGGTDAPDDATGDGHDEALARRLAQLDARLAGTDAATGTSEAAVTNGTAAQDDDGTAAADTPSPHDSTSGEQASPEQAAEQTAEQPAAVQPAATAAVAASDASTAIVVKGLGSFGAITSFKQALERVDGVRGVTLSLGPTGEFVYRASHATDFDLESAIRGIEGEAASIERHDGSYQVTVSRGR